MVEEIHEIPIKSSIIEFNCNDEFYMWKNKLEANTNISFIKENNKNSQKCKTNYFVCNRSGHYVSHLNESSRKRYLKTQGSYKIKAYCPAAIKFVINNLTNTCKIPFDEILNEVHVSRLHLLRRKDLYNIEQCFHLSSSAIRHSNDGVSVESWVEEMKQEKHCVLLY
ncbi:hypothetical protein NQ317_002476 [Molorchus minor]|uniref:FLYWCH-type domain-containing protein n=1 Tax=Molorchus minor TaxID=1323400 RepID=A0ABQ9JG69_9CUCU|nr:hypothetical protein NQ317_002476 [Molorchus minor]